MSSSPDARKVSSPPLDSDEPRDLLSQRAGNRHHDFTAYIRKFSAAIRKKSLEFGHDFHSTPITPRSPRNRLSSREQRPDCINSTKSLPVRTTYKTASDRPPVITTESPTNTFDQTSRPRSCAISAAWSNASITTSIDRSTLQEQRAQRLFAKYGLNMPASADTTDTLKRPIASDPVLRVEKRARLRMHSTCHHCSTIFPAGSKHCRKCAHKRCRECQRAAPRGVRDLVSQTKAALESNPEPATKATSAPARAQSRYPTHTSPNARQSTFPTRTPDYTALLPDADDMDSDADEPLLLSDFLSKNSRSCPFTLTRLIEGAMTPLRPRDSKLVEMQFVPQPRVFRVPKQRRRIACRACGSMFAGLQGFCLGCREGRMSYCLSRGCC